jgi:hypothetical protein
MGTIQIVSKGYRSWCTWEVVDMEINVCVLVLGVTIQVGLISSSGVELDVGTSTVEVLLMLDGVLDDEVLVLVGELGEGGRSGVEAVVLGGTQT